MEFHLPIGTIRSANITGDPQRLQDDQDALTLKALDVLVEFHGSSVHCAPQSRSHLLHII